MRHEPIRVTHRVTIHPDWCTCRSCQPPTPAVRAHRRPAPMILVGSAVGLAIGAVLGELAGPQLAAAFLAATGG